MKKFLPFVLLGLMTTFAACQKDETGASDGAALQKITVTVPSGGVQTRAAADYGDGSKINRCILEIYRDGVRYGDRKVATVSAGQAVFDDLRLVASQTYDFVFWADCSDGGADKHYNTTDLTAITVNGDYTGNDDEFDAFFAKKTIPVTGSFTETVTLSRPFGQLNVQTLDLNEIKDESLKPTHVQVEFSSVPTTFDALAGTAGSEAPLAYRTAVEDVTTGELTVDYIWAAEAKANLADFSMTFYKNGTEIATNDGFTNIPIRRNYRTNVKGNLLTKKGSINVTINPGFADEEYDETITEVATLEEANAALAEGKTNIVVTEAPASSATLTIAKVHDAEDARVSVSLPATSQQLTVAYGAEGQNPPAEVNLTVPNSENLVIDLPQSTVTLNGGTHNSVTATTAANTLIIPENVTVKSLTVNQGSVKLYGEVGAVSKGSSYTGTIYRCVSSQKSFDNLVADGISGYSEILIESAAGAIDGKSAVLTKPMTVSADVTLGNVVMNVPNGEAENSAEYGGYGCAAILVIDGAKNAVFDNIESKNGDQVRTFLVSGTTAGVTVRNSKLIVPNLANKAGFNIHCMTAESVLTANLENCYIGVNGVLLNKDKNVDYDYTDDMTASAGKMTRGVSISCENLHGTVKLDMDGTVAEGISYVVNIAGCHVAMDADIENCILDGRAALNLRGQGGGTYVVKNSKLIGRNWFPGQTENFATIVFEDFNDDGWYTENHVVTLDNTEVVAYSDPQTETNWQYLAQMRSRAYNKLVLRNHSKFREIYNPRLDYLVEVSNPVNEVEWDETFTIEGKEGATVLPGWDGQSAEEIIPNATGEYEVSNAAQLAWIAAAVNASSGAQTFEGKVVKLVADINLYGYEWTPIGNGMRLSSIISGKAFKGTFDGNGKIISNLTINANSSESKAIGLFGNVTGGSVKNLKLKNVSIDVTSEQAGAVVGLLGGGAEISGIEVLSGSVSAAQGTAGIVGRIIKYGTVSNCSNHATITGSAYNIGGIVGAAYYGAEGQTMTIANCKNYGTVTGAYGVGGIVGLSAANVSGCVNEGNVTGAGADVAGIVAEQQNTGHVKGCTNRGTITNTSTAYGTGGIVGWVRYSGATSAYPVKSVIEVSGNTNYGSIDGGNDAGGIVGTVYNFGLISGNKNFAPTLSAATFAAGIVGSAQFTETPAGIDEPNSVKVTNNVSTTALDRITGQCKALYVYINDPEYVTEEGNQDRE